MDIPYTVNNRPDTGLYNAKLGMWLFLASEVMLFGGLFSAYIFLRLGADDGMWPHQILDVKPAFINTMILIISSVTIVQSWAAVKMGNLKKFKLYMGMTILLASAFVGIKSYEYYTKVHHYGLITNTRIQVTGYLDQDKTNDQVVAIIPDKHQAFESGKKFMETKLEAGAVSAGHHEPILFQRSDLVWFSNFMPRYNTFFAIYFTMTALHALHVIGAIVVLAYFWGPGSKMFHTNRAQFANRIEVVGLFWHFVELVWIFLFPVLYLL
ncbi:MAG: heme-copper oxidase subunit III [Blastochloris sp.]|jgi:cytochrome c oxidase subunit 3|nr:heme-copper oxidase subunit III [Blastochloris sp.]